MEISYRNILVFTLLEPEMILASKARIRMLEIVSREGVIPITSLARKAGLNHDDVDGAVRCLVETGLLLDEYQSRSRLVAPNFRRCDVLFTRGNQLEVIVS